MPDDPSTSTPPSDIPPQIDADGLPPFLAGSDQCPWITSDLPTIGGHLLRTPDDFQVDEIPAYPPSGEGDHWFVRIQKRDLTSEKARSILARAAGVSPRDVGMAGRKDRQGVTTQWMSLPRAPKDPGDSRLQILETARHRHKLRTGHVKGNRFKLKLRGLRPDAADRLPALIERIHQGVPNYFGAQRFGRAPEDFEGLCAPLMRRRRRPPREARFMASVVQSAVFNLWLGQRVIDGHLHTALTGDVLRKRETGGLFLCEDPAVDAERAHAGEIDAMGPMIGPKLMATTEEALVREQAILQKLGVTRDLRDALGRLAPGTRRNARLIPEDLTFNLEGDTLDLAFTLPSGAYATIIIGELTRQPDRVDPPADVAPADVDPPESGSTPAPV